MKCKGYLEYCTGEAEPLACTIHHALLPLLPSVFFRDYTNGSMACKRWIERRSFMLVAFPVSLIFFLLFSTRWLLILCLIMLLFFPISWPWKHKTKRKHMYKVWSWWLTIKSLVYMGNIFFNHTCHMIVCLFVTEATRLWVKTGSERGSYANPLCLTTAVTAGSFAAPVLDVFLTPLHGSCWRVNM